MKRATAAVVAAALALGLGAACSKGEAPAPEGDGTTAEAAADPKPLFDLPEELASRAKGWTGDLDGMVARRAVRMLVTYNSTHYYVDRAEQGGATYEAGRLLEQELNRRFKTGAQRITVFFIPVTRDRLLPALQAGFGDIAAANLTITPERLAEVDFSEPFATGIKEVLVTGPGAPAIRSLEDLAGRQVHVRASSSFAESLHAINQRFAREGRKPVEIVPVDERLETEDILELVDSGALPMTVVDDHMAHLWSQIYKSLTLHPQIVLRSDGRLGWAFRKNSPKLARFLGDFVRKNRIGTLTGNMIVNRYLRDAKRITNPGSPRDLARFRATVALFQKYAKEYDFDWLLLTAQAYQESGLDQSKRSPAGAIGIMQLMPRTARDPNVNIRDIQKLDNNIHAGAKYMRFIIDTYFKDAPMDPIDRQLFAFAAYNAGPARIAGLREKARRLGLDPNKWRGNVEVVAAREIGRETVQYVANILKYYVAYRQYAAVGREKDEAKQGAARG